jgi:hypothetical protein
MEMNSGDKFNVVIAFKISALVYWSDLKNLIGVDLSFWTAAFAPLLLSDPPRDLLGVLGHAVRAAARLI